MRLKIALAALATIGIVAFINFPHRGRPRERRDGNPRLRRR